MADRIDYNASDTVSAPNISAYEGSSDEWNVVDVMDEVQIDAFLLTALKNPKDRLTILKLEDEFQRFIKDKRVDRMEFPPMSSYHRMIVHKVAQHYRLQHQVVGYGPQRAILVHKCAATQLPLLRLSELSEQPEVSPKSVKLLKRPTPPRGPPSPSPPPPASAMTTNESTKTHTETESGSNKSTDSLHSCTLSPASSHQQSPPRVFSSNLSSPESNLNSLEAREEAYAKARARIFSDSPSQTRADTTQTVSEVASLTTSNSEEFGSGKDRDEKSDDDDVEDGDDEEEENDRERGTESGRAVDSTVSTSKDEEVPIVSSPVHSASHVSPPSSQVPVSALSPPSLHGYSSPPQAPPSYSYPVPALSPCVYPVTSSYGPTAAPSKVPLPSPSRPLNPHAQPFVIDQSTAFSAVSLPAVAPYVPFPPPYASYVPLSTYPTPTAVLPTGSYSVASPPPPITQYLHPYALLAVNPTLPVLNPNLTVAPPLSRPQSHRTSAVSSSSSSTTPSRHSPSPSSCRSSSKHSVSSSASRPVLRFTPQLPTSLPPDASKFNVTFGASTENATPPVSSQAAANRHELSSGTGDLNTSLQALSLNAHSECRTANGVPVITESPLPHILEVTGLPPDFSLANDSHSAVASEIQSLFAALRLAGATLKHFHRTLCASVNGTDTSVRATSSDTLPTNATTPSNTTQKSTRLWTTLAVFKTRAAAKETMEKLNPTLRTLQLRPWIIKTQGTTHYATTTTTTAEVKTTGKDDSQQSGASLSVNVVSNNATFVNMS
jgi:hypothetical protein